jgi:pimeloyl-ACP methyl ester carboxylesterase
MSALKHSLLQIGGTRIHAVEQGSGPLVVLVHGFPESWYSWRHQLPALAQAGYRAVAIDQRGYGRSSKFWQPEAYRIHKLVADVVGVVQALGESSAVVVGHDWGAPVAWTAAWLHPEIFRGVMGLSVPFSGSGLIALPGSPFGERRPDELHREVAGPGKDFYQTYFGTLGPIIDEIEADLRGWIRDIVWSVSGDFLGTTGIDFANTEPLEFIRMSALCIPHGALMRERFPAPPTMPAWFTARDLDFFVGEFERSGFAGPLNFYRNIDANWHDLAAVAQQPLTAPAMFLGAEYDVATVWGREAIRRAGERMPNYRGTRIFERCGHWIQQERAEDTNKVLLEFLAGL